MRNGDAVRRGDDAVAVLVDFDTLVKMGEEMSDLIKAKDMETLSHMGRRRKMTMVKVDK